MDKYAIILAAGKGTRMKSRLDSISKVSYPILGQPLVRYVLNALKPLSLKEIVTIVGFGGETTERIVKDDSKVVWQREQKGTGHAVMQAAPILAGLEGETIICCGDTPLLTDKTLNALFSSHETNHNDLTVMTAIMDDPRGYGRIVKDRGRVTKIVEQKDCTPEQAAIKEINAGVYVIDNRKLFEHLDKLTPNNAAGEYYLTDVIGMFVEEGLKVGTFAVTDNDETLGINDRYQLSNAAKIIQQRINKAHMLAGVSIEDPATAYIAPGVKIGPDTTVMANTHILGDSVVGERSVIGPNSYLEDVKVGNDAKIIFSHVVGGEVKDGETVGPFAKK